MPIHEYACRGCGHEFETLVRSGETPACEKCAGTDLDKKLSVFAAHGSAAEAAAPACGTCGDPRGPGACRLN